MFLAATSKGCTTPKGFVFARFSDNDRQHVVKQ